MSTATIAPVTEEMRASLAARLAALEKLWELATWDLTVAHVNHVERPGVLPIAFTLLHAITVQDRSVNSLFGGPMLWDAYAAKVGFTGSLPRRGTAMDVAERVRIGDMDAWRAYQREVFAHTRGGVRGASLERLAAHFPVEPTTFDGGFLEMLVGSVQRVRVIDVVEAWIYQHGLRHAGELEHARALVGLRGVA
jgi:hypothetical protein